jgi:type I restriction enzyme S subunit
MEEFKLSDNVDSNKVFIVWRSELEGRIDATFYLNRLDFSETTQLSKIAKIKGGKRIPLGYDYSAEETDNLYLRVANMDESTDFNFSEFKFISDELYQLLNRYEVFENDLIISIAGTVGKTKVLKNTPFGKRIILTENCAKIIPTENIIPEYLNLVLQTSFLQNQISLSYIQTTIPKLGIDKILELRIPKIPTLERQSEIVAIYNQAYSLKQQKEAEAKALLDSIDDYLLEELGITLPSKDDKNSDLLLAAEPKPI